MPAAKPSSRKAHPKRTVAQLKQEVGKTLAWLKDHSSPAVLEGMARYGLPSTHALGVSVRLIQERAKEIGRDQALAGLLWDTGCYEARLLTAYVGEPGVITAAEMERWCREFDNWGVVDTLCFVLFDRTPHAWAKVERWARSKTEFQRRAGFVLLACLAAHDRKATDEQFLQFLPLIEWGAEDERNFVKKGVSWALRMIGRRNAGLKAAAGALARRLSEAESASARWVGKDALRQFAAKGKR